MNLTTLARAKSYLAGSSAALPGLDAVYGQLVGAASAAVCDYCSRTFQRATFTNMRLNGSGSSRQALPSNPIISVSSVMLGATAVPVSADGCAYGYQYDSKMLYLFGASFPMGSRNVGITFSTGWATTESGTIPAAPYQITPKTGSGIDAGGNPSNTSGYAYRDEGVTINGVAAVAVASGPSAGQYSFSSEGVYTFAAADMGKAAVMSYDFIPAAVEQAALDTMGTWLKQKDNLGIASKSLANETVSYRDLGLSKSSQAILQPYRWGLLP